MQYAVLIQPLEDGRQLRDTLFRCTHFLAAGGVLLLAAVLVLLNQQLHKPGFMLCGIGGHLFQIGGYTGGQ